MLTRAEIQLEKPHLSPLDVAALLGFLRSSESYSPAAHAGLPEKLAALRGPEGQFANAVLKKLEGLGESTAKVSGDGVSYSFEENRNKYCSMLLSMLYVGKRGGMFSVGITGQLAAVSEQ